MLEAADVLEVLRAARCALVGDEGRLAEHAKGEVTDLGALCVAGGGDEVDAGERREDVDPPRGEAELVDGAGAGEVVAGDSVGADGRAEGAQAGEDALGVVGGRLDELGEVAGGPDDPVGSEGVVPVRTIAASS